MEKKWIRYDLETGEEEELTEAQVKHKIDGYYRDSELALTCRSVSEDNPLTTPYANYYPKED